jgi:hypothetical protein
MKPREVRADLPFCRRHDSAPPLTTLMAITQQRGRRRYAFCFAATPRDARHSERYLRRISISEENHS